MSLDIKITGEAEVAVHYPAKPDKFEFDAEVAAIFPNMARRSIPTYEDGHLLHAAICANLVKNGGSVLDIGASHGEFFKALDREFAHNGGRPKNLRLVATDNSVEMCKWMNKDLTGVEVVLQDLMENEFLQSKEKFDFINCMYVIQFLPEFAQRVVLTKLCSMLKPGGILSIGQKELHVGPVGDTLHDAYIGFRLRNGYSMEEISRKTAALKNSMWPMTKNQLLDIMSYCDMGTVTEVTRWGVFATYVVQR
jgi:tRNA (cmo5U34)-methyltransferase